MNRRLGLLCAGIIAAVSFFASTADGGGTMALWSATATPPALPSVQAAHGTATAQAVATSGGSVLFTPSTSSSDPQTFTTTAASSGSGLTYGPSTGCTLKTPYGSATLAYPMCAAYHLNVTAVQNALVAAMTANPPSSATGTMPTYTVTGAIELDAELWGYPELDAAFSVAETIPSGSIVGASTVQMSFVSSLSACAGTATSGVQSGATVLIPAGNGDKKATEYLCYVQSYTPSATYQTTVTATNGSYTHDDSWWAPLYDSASGTVMTVTIGLNPQD